VRIVAEVMDEVRRDAHHDDRADEVQRVCRGDEGAMHFVRANGWGAVVGVCVGAASHFDGGEG
jgi:hypothetical protein